MTGGKFDKRNVVRQGRAAWVAKGGRNFDKRNVVLELESLKAWVAKGGGMLSGRVAKHGLPRGGKMDKRNVVLELDH